MAKADNESDAETVHRARSKGGSKTARDSKRSKGRNGTVRRVVRAASSASIDNLDSRELLERYLEQRDPRWRDALAERHLPDVVEIARTLANRLPNSVDLEDLCNAGYSGLLRCVETFDPMKGRSFVSYMKQRVYGSMIDELRAMDWLPRLMRSRLAHRDQIVQEMSQELGRDPADEEIAERIGISLAIYRQSFPSQAPNLIGTGLLPGTLQELDGLEPNIVGIGGGRRDQEHPLTPLYHRELIKRIHGLLSETEWELVSLHYFEGLKLRDVAQRLELSPARICQIHGQVLQRLKAELREEGISI